MERREVRSRLVRLFPQSCDSLRCLRQPHPCELLDHSRNVAANRLDMVVAPNQLGEDLLLGLPVRDGDTECGRPPGGRDRDVARRDGYGVLRLGRCSPFGSEMKHARCWTIAEILSLAAFDD